MVLIALSNNNSLNQLFARFYSHENQHNLNFSSSVIEALDKRGIGYTLSSIYATLNLTDVFKDNFTSVTNKNILDFVVQTRLRQYPPVVAEMCAAYLKEISSGKPEKYLLEHIVDWICVKHV